MTGPVTSVLFLCTQNSARSILAECVLNRLGEGRWRGYSAGSRPRGEPHPDALSTLRREGYDVSGLASKSWDVFAAPDAPQIDIVVTVCDSAAREACPVWPGHPVTAHWGLPDPARESDPEARQRAFAETLGTLEKLIADLVQTRPAPDPAATRARLAAIGRTVLQDRP